jgi:hypothetical protein
MTVHQLHRSPQKDLLPATGGTAILEFTHGASRESGAESRNPPCKLKSFGTKAETLAALQPLVHFATVPDLLFFSVAEWNTDPEDIILEIGRRFNCEPVVFRSSALNEDGNKQSQAGAFTSCLDIDSGDPQAIRKAVQEVINSFDGCPEDQVLVMPMLTGVTMSGVIMTFVIDSGAPYYVLNYDDESGKTDTITGGTGVNKTVLVHRDFASGHVDSPRVSELLNLARELEGLCERGTPLDIEFAKTQDGQLHLLQVRRITVQKNWNRRIARYVGEALFQAERFVKSHSRPKPHVAGTRTILGQMPDWNPAEIIGTRPKPLAISLYRHLITDSVWQEARATMGYQPVPHTPLMLTLGGQPYIDVRASFNSFLPANLPQVTREKLVNAWLNRLEAHPEFHDKVEFEIAQTIIDFNFAEDYLVRYRGVLNHDEYRKFRFELAQLTATNLSLDPEASLPTALRQIQQLEGIQSSRNDNLTRDTHLEQLPVLLDECKDLGTRPFSIIARHAFIAETILRSAITRNALSESRLSEFKRSLHTITADFTNDFAFALENPDERKKFNSKYGHLRPGTYDITSPRYDQRDDLFAITTSNNSRQVAIPFGLTNNEIERLEKLFAASGLGAIDPRSFFEYARLAITNRERAKFIFTRHLSDALELVANWGETQGLNRDALAHIAVQDLLDHLVSPILNDPEIHFKDLIEHRRREGENMGGIRLGYLIRDPRDLYVVPLHRSTPNFVTDKRIESVPLKLDNQTHVNGELTGRIICIENADPGFDWIFTRGIAGLVSKFGGANSHMTIRCAELGLPAAIGVGEQTFERIASAERVELDGASQLIRPIYG